MTQPNETHPSRDAVSKVVPADFIPCRCGQSAAPDILVHRCLAPCQLRGDLYLVCCSWCGRAAPFVSVAMRRDIVMPEAITAWNRLESTTPAAINPQGVGSAAAGDALDILRALTACCCHESYTSRGLDDPNCNHSYREDVDTIARQLAEANKLSEELNNLLIDWKDRTKQANCQLAEANRRLVMLEVLVKRAVNWMESSGDFT